VEITGKPDLYALTGSLRSDIGFDDEGKLTRLSTERKSPARETFAVDFVDSHAAGL
jgi:hypothetical protein